MPRFNKVKITHQLLDGRTETQTLTGYMARVVQHEFDHLQGKLITDYLEPGDTK